MKKQTYEMESCEDCPFYDHMNGDCAELDKDGDEYPIIAGRINIDLNEVDNENNPALMC